MLEELLRKNHILINPSVHDKRSLMQLLAQKALDMGYIRSTEEMLQNVYEKDEALGPIQLSTGIILPHGRGAFVTKLFVMFAIFGKGISYEGLPVGHKANLVIFIGAPEGSPDYLQVLASLSRFLEHDASKNAVLSAHVEEDVLYALHDSDSEVYNTSSDASDEWYILMLALHKDFSSRRLAPLFVEAGVFAPLECQGTNIAHATFMVPLAMSLGGHSQTYSRLYWGTTRQADAAQMLCRLLKLEGFDLAEPGAGFLTLVKADVHYGGTPADTDF